MHYFSDWVAVTSHKNQNYASAENTLTNTKSKDKTKKVVSLELKPCTPSQYLLHKLQD